MAIKTFRLPDPGEGLLEADIVTWHVKPGDTVKTNDIVVEIETAKSLVELPIPWDGTVAQVLVQEGATVDVGTPIITIDDGTGDEPGSAAPQSAGEAAVGGGAAAEGEEEPVKTLVGYGPKASSATRRPRKGAQPDSPAPSETEGKTVLAKPPVRKYAKDHGVDLAQVDGTGALGLIRREDVEAYLATRAGGAQSDGAQGVSPTTGAAERPAAAFGTGERETRLPVKGVRKVTAAAMVGSAFTAPHVTEFVTIDCTATMDLVDRLKADREWAGVKVSPLLILAKAMILAIKRNPGVNATWDEAAQEIVVKNYVNLGIAAATPRGLLVPNIKDAHALDLRGLADALAGLVATARDGKTPPADMSGGTITITNVGVFGIDSGTPIINPGESAIMCFGAISKRPWVVTSADGYDTIEPRWVTTLGLSFDHRLIDGELGSRFLADVAKVLADPSTALLW